MVQGQRKATDMRDGTRIELEVIREAMLPLLLWYRNLMILAGVVAASAAILYGVVHVVIPAATG